MNLKRLKPEDQFIIQACSLNQDEAMEALQYVSDNFDWDYYWEESVRNGIPGILYKHFKRYPEIARVVPGAIHKKHEQYYYQTLARNTRIFNELDKVLEFLHSKGFDKIVLLKGAYLLPEVYKDLGARPMSDIDMVMPKEDALEAHRLLQEEMGYFEPPSLNKWHREWRIEQEKHLPDLVKDGQKIDMHWKLEGHDHIDWHHVIKKGKRAFLPEKTNEVYLKSHFSGHIDKHNWQLKHGIDLHYLNMELHSILTEITVPQKEMHFMQRLRNMLIHKGFRFIMAAALPSPNYMKYRYNLTNNTQLVFYYPKRIAFAFRSK